MPYWRAFYHIVWATKERHPLIAENIEEPLYRVIGSKCHEKDAYAFVINGMPDHIHVVAAVPPKLALSRLVGFIKGASSAFVQQKYDMPFKWQRGYGLFTISRGNLQQAIEYVERQKQHHKDGTFISAYERVAYADEGPIK